MDGHTRPNTSSTHATATVRSSSRAGTGPHAAEHEKTSPEPRTVDLETNYEFYSNAPPPLNFSVHAVPGRRRAIIVWAVLFFVEAGVLPLVLFYGIRWGTHLSITTNLAIITSLIGTISSFKLTQRTWYLWYREGHEHRRPIGAGRWGVDCFQ